MKFRLRSKKYIDDTAAAGEQNVLSETERQVSGEEAEPGDASLRELREQARQSISRRKGMETDEEDDGEEQKRAAALLLRRRALLRAARRVLRARRLTLLLVGAALVILGIFIASVIQERMGNFTININRMDMYRQGLMLSETEDFEDPKSRLKAVAVENATNISVDDLPDDLDQIEGSHNGKDYMAYTFYVRNGGREKIDYIANIIIEMEAKGVSDAVRVAVYDDTGRRAIYAKRAANGEPEPGTIPFINDQVIMARLVEDFEVNDVDRYTVVSWLEGDDPECVDAIIGGMIRMSMNLEVDKPIKDR